jgi:LPXTG-motif cell wall-anchored protein
MRGVFNIIIGVVFIVGGLSGRLVLLGTESGIALAVLGLVLVGLGVFRLVRRNQ